MSKAWTEGYLIALGIMAILTVYAVAIAIRMSRKDKEASAKLMADLNKQQQNTVLDFDTRRLRQQASEEYRRQAMDELGIVETGTQYSAEYTGGNINYVPTEERMVYYGRWTPSRGEEQ